jgi:predicted ester cyclase
MRKIALLCVVAMVCSAWVLGLVEQRTTASPSNLGPRQPLPGRGQAAAEPGIVVRRVFDDLLNKGRYELIDTIYTRDCRVHSGNKSSRLEAAVAEGKGWREAAPDLQVTIGEMSARGEKVLVSWTAMGVQTGRGNGLRPSGKHFVIHGRSEFRVVNGRIAEVWNHWNRDDLYRQVGVNPKVAHLFEMVRELGRHLAAAALDAGSAAGTVLRSAINSDKMRLTVCLPGPPALAARKETEMRKRLNKKLRLNRETVLRLEREPLRQVVAALAAIGVKPGQVNTSPLCVATCCASGCDECDSGRVVMA